MPAAPETGGGLVLIHLSQVKETLRLSAADRMIRVGGLSGTAAMELKMAALFPRQDPSLLVTAEQARKARG